jgi:hypothetical protein
MRCHSVVLSWVDVPNELMYRWDDVNLGHCFLVVINKEVPNG